MQFAKEDSMVILAINKLWWYYFTTIDTNFIAQNSFNNQCIQSFEFGNKLFSKLAIYKCDSTIFFTWRKALNSNGIKYNARVSKKIILFLNEKKYCFRLKYYKKKYGNNNAIGIIKGKFFAHVGEAVVEIWESVFYKKTSMYDDPFSDPQLKNAKRVLQYFN